MSSKRPSKASPSKRRPSLDEVLHSGLHKKGADVNGRWAVAPYEPGALNPMSPFSNPNSNQPYYPPNHQGRFYTNRRDQVLHRQGGLFGTLPNKAAERGPGGEYKLERVSYDVDGQTETNMALRRVEMDSLVSQEQFDKSQTTVSANEIAEMLHMPLWLATLLHKTAKYMAPKDLMERGGTLEFEGNPGYERAAFWSRPTAYAGMEFAQFEGPRGYEQVTGMYLKFETVKTFAKAFPALAEDNTQALTFATEWAAKIAENEAAWKRKGYVGIAFKNGEFYATKPQSWYRAKGDNEFEEKLSWTEAFAQGISALAMIGITIYSMPLITGVARAAVGQMPTAPQAWNGLVGIAQTSWDTLDLPARIRRMKRAIELGLINFQHTWL